jgi:hypothetical protein
MMTWSFSSDKQGEGGQQKLRDGLVSLSTRNWNGKEARRYDRTTLGRSLVFNRMKYPVSCNMNIVLSKLDVKGTNREIKNGNAKHLFRSSCSSSSAGIP